MWENSRMIHLDQMWFWMKLLSNSNDKQCNFWKWAWTIFNLNIRSSKHYVHIYVTMHSSVFNGSVFIEPRQWYARHLDQGSIARWDYLSFQLPLHSCLQSIKFWYFCDTVLVNFRLWNKGVSLIREKLMKWCVFHVLITLILLIEQSWLWYHDSCFAPCL